MTIKSLILWLLALGVIGYLINAYIPMQEGIKRILNVVLIVVALLIVLAAFGVLPLGNQQVPQLRFM